MDNIFSIAIDGPAGAGKSTVAREAAKRLNAKYLDTGAMYRTVGLYFMRLGLLDDPAAMARLVDQVPISLRFVGDEQFMFLEDEDVSKEIRTEKASNTASKVSAVPEIRSRMVAMQRELASGSSIIMDGRDIATVVLPNATLKIFITARAEVRAMRRYKQLIEKGKEAVYEKVLEDIVQRDYNDSHRAASPMEVAQGAVVMDTSDMSFEQSVDEIIRLLNEAVGG